jgi:5-methylcytosine-specific restriction endonuclease McrA
MALPSRKAGQTIEALGRRPFPCPNCDKPISEPKLFCSELCRDEAKCVRYFRACIADGRFEQADVQEALRIRLALILGGGYPEHQRQLSQAVRDAIIARDKGRCRKCGGPGSQIDHIRGSSDDLDNLQLLCPRCHNVKTTDGFVTILPETHPEEWAKREALLARVHAPQPSRLCDGTNWDKLWRPLLKVRREAAKDG